MKKNNTSLTLYSLLVLLVIHMYACTSQRGTSYPQENCLACEAIGIECLVRVNTYDTIGIKNGHEYVDLGLPSGTLWATCNIGAEKPEAFGDYFQWAGIRTVPGHDSLFIYSLKGRKEFSPYNCIDSTFRDSIFPTRKKYKFTKYNSYAKLGIVDNKKELDLEDDAAHVYWGAKWRVPSKDQIEELIYYTKQTNCVVNGVSGKKLTSKVEGFTDKFIFLPYSAFVMMFSTSIKLKKPNHKYVYTIGSEKARWTHGIIGNYWIRELAPPKYIDNHEFMGWAYIFRIRNSGISSRCETTQRHKPCSIRPVWQQ